MGGAESPRAPGCDLIASSQGGVRAPHHRPAVRGRAVPPARVRRRLTGGGSGPQPGMSVACHHPFSPSITTELKISATQMKGFDYGEVMRDFRKPSPSLDAVVGRTRDSKGRRGSHTSWVFTGSCGPVLRMIQATVRLGHHLRSQLPERSSTDPGGTDDHGRVAGASLRGACPLACEGS